MTSLQMNLVFLNVQTIFARCSVDLAMPCAGYYGTRWDHQQAHDDSSIHSFTHYVGSEPSRQPRPTWPCCNANWSEERNHSSTQVLLFSNDINITITRLHMRVCLLLFIARLGSLPLSLCLPLPLPLSLSLSHIIAWPVGAPSISLFRHEFHIYSVHVCLKMTLNQRRITTIQNTFIK